MAASGTVSLAYWHSYKQVSLQLWKELAHDIWAPLFHNLFPSVTFFPKPSSLAMVTALFQCVKLAYPKFKQALRSGLDKTGDVPEFAHRFTALKDIEFLCEFAIPVVHAPTLPSHINTHTLI